MSSASGGQNGKGKRAAIIVRKAAGSGPCLQQKGLRLLWELAVDRGPWPIKL
jgi:hypothetical protein